MTVAEFDDIEYEGIGGDSHIDVRSERCFRDHSPGDTVISLSDDGQALYTYPIPSFHALSQSHPRPDLSSQQTQSHRNYNGVTETESPGGPRILCYDTLISIQQHEQPGSVRGLSPLTRYRRDTQGHERLALGMKAEDLGSHLDLESPPPCSKKANGVLKCSKPSIISSLHLSPASHQTPSSSPIPSMDPETSSAAEQLRELLNVIETPGWDEDVSPEEQAEYLLRTLRRTRER
ncbi:hypothetical protein F5Y00DRAFT_250069 [Daldinia vernicosa]|uniref:uncharacterized protein n=1 Tax=Daldinia vernicosa TaxID=114800 RepID=UPI0020078DAC|nr:uncharacterized protein F5Y00DRAFT_250069 [Daldinia vernicosa]KAI0843877.1 hypothetical protein F5Y00DRAFT_250069 [Daldinia vernicosa]